VLCDVIFPGARSPDSIGLALDYCRERGLDVMKRPVNIVPMYDERQKKWVETIWPSINETQITAARSHEWAGMALPEWGPDCTQTFTDDKNHKYEVTFPMWCAVQVYRCVKGERCAFVEPVFWLEACGRTGGDSGVPNRMWRKRPRGQLHKVAKAAALRAAFPEESAGPSDDEMDGQPLFSDEGEPVTATAPVVRVDLPAIQSAEDEPIDHGDDDQLYHEKPFTIQMEHGTTWGEFVQPLTRYILQSTSIEEYDEWRLKNQDMLLKLKQSKPELFKNFENSIAAKHEELIAR
jgi:phage recombination protein Bet